MIHTARVTAPSDLNLDWVLELDDAIGEAARSAACDVLVRGVAVLAESARLASTSWGYAVGAGHNAHIGAATTALASGSTRTAAGCLVMLRSGLVDPTLPLIRLLAEAELHAERIELDNSGAYAERWINRSPTRIRHLFAARGARFALEYGQLSSFAHAGDAFLHNLNDHLIAQDFHWSLIESDADRDLTALLVSAYAQRIAFILIRASVRALEAITADGNAPALASEQGVASIEELLDLCRLLLDQLLSLFERNAEIASSLLTDDRLADEIHGTQKL